MYIFINGNIAGCVRNKHLNPLDVATFYLNVQLRNLKYARCN
ncbi:hypothetical protein SAMN04487996_122171 [Dyadobacter soli]|uniref:Uncharacterized protein n=1 Tax=Dyadobacter soli TaxID=659014 RepID=A0A1G7WUJ9_9BACT|nr:hypothetical protein SAMN04487996_122171 [Dyadobacter soli]